MGVSGISRKGLVDRDRSERVPLCIPAKFGLSNHVSPPYLLDTRRPPSDNRSESREMIWQRSNRSSGEGFAGPDLTGSVSTGVIIISNCQHPGYPRICQDSITDGWKKWISVRNEKRNEMKNRRRFDIRNR